MFVVDVTGVDSCTCSRSETSGKSALETDYTTKK